MLEYFVHIDKDDPPTDLVLAIAEIPDDVTTEQIHISELPANWRIAAAPPELVSIGDEFVEKRQHCLLLVPSVLSPNENNCLLNPTHPDYNRIAFLELEDLNYDPRMFAKTHSRRRR